MLHPRKTILVPLAFFLFSFIVPAVKADTIIIGTTTSFGTNLPFGFNVASTVPVYRGEYQQIYSRNRFTSAAPLAITQVAFASSSFSNPSTAIYDLTINLSTARTSTLIPSTNFAANRGADSTTVFSGSLTAVLSARNEFDLVINFTTPFIYDWREGDLLLDILINPVDSNTGSLSFANGTSTETTRVYYPAGDPRFQPVVDRAGLYTRFTAEPIPEPTTMLLFGTGLAGILMRYRRRISTSRSKEGGND